MITEQKWEKLRERMASLGIREQDLGEQFIRGSGRGGQKTNKTSSCVQLIYASAEVEIRCSKTRSQADNRYWARKLLCDRVEEVRLGAASQRQQAAEKIRRQKRRRSRRAKARMLDEKSRVSRKKQLRGRVKPDE